MVYAHRPQIRWNSITNTIINIAYCEGRSRTPSALLKFCEENLFKIIDPDVISEILCGFRIYRRKTAHLPHDSLRSEHYYVPKAKP